MRPASGWCEKGADAELVELSLKSGALKIFQPPYELRLLAIGFSFTEEFLPEQVGAYNALTQRWMVFLRIALPNNAM